MAPIKLSMPSSSYTVLVLNIFFSCWVGGVLCAQSTQLHFRHFTTNDGLPSSETYTVIEDETGYMWFGTDNGVARFDGYGFEVFDTNDGLDDVVVFTLLADDIGRIWAGTYSGDVYYFENGRFHAYAFNDVLQEARKYNEFVHLIDVRDTNNVIIRLQKSGLHSIDKTGEIRPLKIGKSDGLSFYAPECSGPGAYSLAPITRNYPENLINESNDVLQDYPIYVGNEDCFRQIGKVRLFLSDKSLWPIRHLRLVPDGESEKLIYVTTSKMIITGNGIQQKEVLHLKYLVNYVLPITNKSFWLGAQSGYGLQKLMFDADDNLAGVDTFLLGRSVSFIASDSYGGLWVTTTDAGVYYCPFPEQEKYLLNPDVKPLTVAATGENGFYAGYADGSLYQYDGNNKRATELEVRGPFGGRHEFMTFDSLSNTLFTSHLMLVHQPEVEPGNKTRNFNAYYAKGKESFRGVDIISTSNRLGQRKGLCANSVRFGILDLDTREVEFISQSTKHFYGVEALLIDSLNRYLIGTLNGLMVYNPSQPDATLLPLDLGAEELSTRIVKILEYQGGLLFATRGEGMVFLKNGKKTVIKERDGLASDMVRDFEITENGIVWIATLAGLSKLTYGDNGIEVLSYQEEEGLINNEVLDVAVYGEQVWLATNSGIQKFQEIPPVDFSAPPIITRFTVDTAIIKERRGVSIGAGIHNIEISFGTINYRLGDKVLYRYRLGDEEPWRFTKERNVTFPRLGAGEFAFAVASQNEAGIWSASKEISFSIATPWYATWWAGVLGLLLTLGTITWFFLRREKNRKRENDFLLQISRLEHEALHAQMNPHFVFNALNSIQNFVLHNDAKQAAIYLSRFALVVRQTLNSSVKGKHSLTQEIEMLETYLVLEKLRFKEGFEYEIKVAPGLPVEHIILPPLLIQPFVENAILHGLKEIDAGGVIQISFSGDKQLLRVEIRDNGTGIEEDHQIGEESMGMAITRRRLEMMKGGDKNVSRMSVDPVYDVTGTMSGTRVQLWIYLEKTVTDETVAT
ncbi:MAG: histidine kinase [Lewinella sp.]